MNRKLAIACLLALVLTPLARADIAADLTRLDHEFMKTAAGEASADRTVEAYATLVPDDISAPLVLAYLGAAQTLQGREAWMPWNKMKATERGLATLDKALRQLSPRHDAARLRGNPVAFETRVVAATTFLAVPDSIFHRADQGRGLLLGLVAQADFPALPPTLRARVHQQLGAAAVQQKNPGEAAEQWRRCLAAETQGRVADDCRQRLKEIGA